jgi:hypothetical protein
MAAAELSSEERQSLLAVRFPPRPLLADRQPRLNVNRTLTTVGGAVHEFTGVGLGRASLEGCAASLGNGSTQREVEFESPERTTDVRELEK